MEKIEDLLKPKESNSFVIRVHRGEGTSRKGYRIGLSTLMDGFTPLVTITKDGREVEFIVDKQELARLAIDLFDKYKDDPDYSYEVKKGGDEK